MYYSTSLYLFCAMRTSYCAWAGGPPSIVCAHTRLSCARRGVEEYYRFRGNRCRTDAANRFGHWCNFNGNVRVV